jgi:hypothetical protein
MKNVTIPGSGVAAAPTVEPTPHKPQHHGAGTAIIASVLFAIVWARFK